MPVVSALVPLLFAACGAPADSAAPIELTLTASPLLPNVVTAAWTPPTGGTSVVEWGLDGAFDHTTPAAASPPVVVLGLPIDGTVTLRGVTTEADGSRVETSEVELALTPPDPAIPAPVVTSGDPDAPGYVLLNAASSDHTWVLIVDRAGRVVWYGAPDEGQLSTSSVISRDGTSVLFSSYPGDMLVAEGSVKRRALDGSAESAITTPGHHHDFVELPDRSIAFLAARVEVWDGKEVLGDEIRVASGEGEPTTVFSAWDVLTPYAMCSHFEPVPYAENAWDWVHTNSIRYDEGQDRFLLMSRNLNALFAINAGTGAIEWQLGGAESDFQFIDDRGFDHGHFSDWWEGGLAVFDNGMHQEPPASRAIAYAVDEEAWTVTPVWSAAAATYNEMLGDVRSGTDGTWLVAWSGEGRIEELDADGATTWELQLPDGYHVGHVTRLDSLGAP